MHSNLVVLWKCLVVSSVVALLFYRAPDGHGPDMYVGELVVILVPSIVAFFVGVLNELIASGEGAWFALYAVLIGIVEFLLYHYVRWG